MIGGGDNMIVVRGVLRGIATEENLSPILLESVVKRIEHLRSDKITRDEHISSSKWFGLQKLESCFDYFLCRWKSDEREDFVRNWRDERLRV